MLQIQNWHDDVFGEIITNYDGQQYELLIPKRHGATFMISRLARYFASIGKDVRVIGDAKFPFSHKKPLTKDTVLLIDGIIKWDPSYPMQKAGGTLITAWAPFSDLHHFRPFKIIRKMELNAL